MSNLGNFIWAIADQIRGVYKPAQYGTVMLPFLILRRMECVLDEHRSEIDALVSKYPSNDSVLATMLRQRFDVHFWNTSPWTLKKVLDDPLHLAANLEEYVNSFSANVADIFKNFEFTKTVAKLDENDRLNLVVQRFAEIDLHPGRVSNADMGDVFEHLIFKFSTASNETAGEHFTPRDAVRLIVDLVLAADDELLTTPGIVRAIYDPTAGTGGMLSIAEEHIRAMNPGATVRLAGQELNPESYAVCKSDMIGKGQAVDAIRQGDTLADDKHEGELFDYCLSNPPYGGEWKASEKVVRAEHAKGGGRFDAGLPRISDGQTLFLQHLVSKLRPARANDPSSGGRAGIVLNGSPLFTGGAGSGESEIRRHLLESDLVDAIVALPTNMFYNTGIATYVWILDNNKRPERKGKIQLIDATSRWTKLKKNLGSKNREISDADREAIVKLYEDFAETEDSKILEPADFGYWEITVEQPLRLRFEVTQDKIDDVLAISQVAKLSHDDKASLRTALIIMTGKTWTNRDQFVKDMKAAMKSVGLLAGAPVIKAIWTTLGESDPDADICRDAKRNIEPDTSLRDTELVPFRDDIDTYVKREVAPYLPDAWIDESRTKIGYEIPFTRLFYKYVPPRSLEEIDADLAKVTAEILELLQAVGR